MHCFRSRILFNLTGSCLKQYERFKPETKLKVVYYYDTITVEDSPAYAETFANKLKKDGMTLWEAAKKGCEIYRIDSNRLKNTRRGT